MQNSLAQCGSPHPQSSRCENTGDRPVCHLAVLYSPQEEGKLCPPFGYGIV